jgi:hypothetical protein
MTPSHLTECAAREHNLHDPRGRAYGITGDYLETDPACSHFPKGA